MSERTPHPLWVERALLASLEREPLRIKQRILRSLSLLCVEGVATRDPSALDQERGAWRPLIHPAVGQVERLAGEELWWKVREGTVEHDETSSEDTSREDTRSHHGFEVRRASRCHLEELSVAAGRPLSSESAHVTLWNPLCEWVRSPDQANIRRALLTQRHPALFIKSAHSAGSTLGLAAAVCDWVNDHLGECVFVTPSARQVKQLIHALSPLSNRVIVITPDELISLLLKSVPLPHDEERDQVMTSPLHGGRVATRPSREEWSLWREWATQNLSALGPWADDLSELRRITLTHVFSAGAPQRQENLLNKPGLSHLSEAHRARLAELAVSLWESPLGQAHRLLSEHPPTEWPWPEARALLIDDCLELSWPVLYSTLRFADEHLGASGRRWTLALSGLAREGASAYGVSWSELTSLVKGALGRPVYQLNLTMSERLSPQRVRSLRPLYERCVSEVEAPAPQSLPSAMLTTPSMTEIDASSLLYVSLNPTEPSPLKDVIKTCIATPGAYLLDLTSTSTSSLSLELSDAHFDSSLQPHISRKVIEISDLAELEPQWLIVYHPSSTISESERGDPVRGERANVPHHISLSWRESLDELCYLLTRAPTPLIWIGAPPLSQGHEDRFASVDLSAALQLISQRSPWGGLTLFDHVERAQVFTEAGDTQEAIECWLKARSALSAILGIEGERRASTALEGLYLDQLKGHVERRQWSSLKERYRELSEVRQPEGITASALAEAQRSLRDALSSEIARVDAAILQKDLLGVHDASSGIEVLVELIDSFDEDPLKMSLIRERLYHWSDQLLEARIPQAEVQSQLLMTLIHLEPHAVEYHCLLRGYQEPPSANNLSVSALKYLTLSPRDLPEEHQRHRWGLSHLTRWLTYLLNLKEYDPSNSLSVDALCLGFAVVAVRGGDWEVAQTLFALVASPKPTNGEPIETIESIEKSPSAEKLESLLTQRWRAELIERLAHREESEREQRLRERGDLRGLHEYYKQRGGQLPLEITGALQVLEALEAMRDGWHLLSEGERETLRQSWGALVCTSEVEPLSTAQL